ncbi:hypothetical protein [Cellvibrio sp. OA-2007]|uniref:hypothetical protein n=1 Tax=Cellvibrio sp. OA-2007 TaxID=529823 RepID=UPI00078581F6|nr:hypothetical protein [Cellvibrio sp. OA-2007]
MLKKSLLALSLGLIALNTSAAEKAPTNAELWKIIKEQQAELDALKSQQQETAKKADATDAKVESTAAALDLSSTASNQNKTVIGGYGELHLNRWDNDKPGGSDKKEMDFHRFVLLFSHEFSDTVRFFSEFELEHGVAGEGKKGEVELEQAYVEWDYSAKHSLKSGVFLVPVGIINETHEPDTFYGVERNSVENKIIPSTWWEGGVAFSGELAQGLSYDFAAHSGLALATGKFQVRDGRQKVSEAKADSFAYTSRLKYTAIPGLELAASVQLQEDFTQGAGATEIGATLFEAHAVYQTGPFGLRALYAQWNIDDAINTVASGADKQSGWYIEPSLRLNEQWGIFTRYNEWDNQAGDSADSNYSEWNLGANFWLSETTVFKFDLMRQEVPAGKDEYAGFNLGVGYSF